MENSLLVKLNAWYHNTSTFAYHLHRINSREKGDSGNETRIIAQPKNLVADATIPAQHHTNVANI